MKRLDSVAILASAGSGKTFALTTRYLALLLSGVAPERILAVTFTRAAAGEILDRLFKRLCDASASDDAARVLESQLRENDSVPVPVLNAAACRRALRALVSVIDRLGVGTIDGFFARMAGAMALDLDLPPGWRIADEDEVQRLKSRAVEEIVEGAGTEETLRLVRLLHGGMYSARVFDAVLGSVDAAYSAYLDADARAWEEIGPLTEPLDEEALRTAVANLRGVRLPTNADGTTAHGQWKKAHGSKVTSAEHGEWDVFLGGGVPGAIGDGKTAYYNKPIDDEVRGAYEPLIAHARAVLVSRLRDKNLATRDALARFDAAYSGVRRRMGVSTFDDVPRALVRAEVAGDLEHVYYALDGRIDHALIDEFQDTSVAQFRLLRPLMDEMAQDDSGARSLLCVGDVKQSLYQWRNAEPELLPSLLSEWETMTERPLDVSRRSSPEIIDAVNAVFGSLTNNPALIATDEGAAAAAAWQGRFHEHRTVIKEPGIARLLVTPGPADGSEHMERAARHIADLAARFPGESVGVLFPKWKRVARLLARLRELGVDAVVEAGAGVSDSPAVAAVLSLMELADHPGNSASEFHVAASPLGSAVGLTVAVGFGRADGVAAGVRRELLERGYGPTIARWAGLVRGSCSARDAERLVRLVELAERFDGGAGGRPSEFVAFVGSARSAETSDAQVRLMTVHGSKGLQFTSVVLADLDGTIKPRPPGVVVERASALAPVAAVSRYASDLVRAGHPRLEAMHTGRFARLIGEWLSVLYVAMTRAERRLDVLISPREMNGDWPKTFAGLLHWALAPDAERNAGETLWQHGEDRAAMKGSGASRAKVGVPGVDEHKGPIALGAASGKTTRSAALAPSRAGEERPATIAEALVARAPASSAAMARGTLVHAWMEGIDWLDRALTVDRVREVSERSGVAWDEGRAALAAELVRAVGSGPVADLLSKHGAAERAPPGAELSLYRERALAARVAIGSGQRLVIGRIDRMVVARSGGRVVGVEIVDYKTDGWAGTDAEVGRSYGPQLRAYRAAVAALYAVPAGAVRCGVALVMLGRVVWVG